MARMIRVFHRSDLANLVLRVADWGWWIDGWGGFFLVNFPQIIKKFSLEKYFTYYQTWPKVI